MQPAELRAAISYDNFRPFRLRLKDGREIVCRDRTHYAMADGACIAVFQAVLGNPTILGCNEIEVVEPL